jgi:hypothetical protein
MVDMAKIKTRGRPLPRATLSIVQDVLNILEGALSGLSLTYNGKAFAFFQRKILAVPQQPNPLSPSSWGAPLMCLAVGEEKEYKDATSGTPSNPGFRFVDYPCGVAIGTATGNQLEFDGALASIVQQVRYTATLHSTWYGVLPEFNEVNGYGRNPFNLLGLEKTQNYRIVTFTVQTLEPRA